MAMQLALERDLERVASDMSESTLIGITVRSNNGDDAIRQLSVRPSQSIHDTIVAAFSCDPAQVEAVEFGGEAVEEGATYEDYGVEVVNHRLFVWAWRCVAGLAQYWAELMCVCW